MTTHTTRRLRALGLILSCLITLVPLGAQEQSEAPLPISLISSAETRHKGARIGLEVVRISDGTTLYAHRSDELFTPASIVKVLSTGAAMRQRGHRHRFTTQIYAVGLLGEGRLKGGLLVVGGGDPSIASAYIPRDSTRLISEVTTALAQAGIQSIEGRIFVDGSLPRGLGVHPSWASEDITRPYGAGLYGLNVRDNAITATLRAPRSGSAPVEVIPGRHSRGIEWRSAITTGRARGVSATLSSGEPSVQLSGRMARGTTKHLRLANPDPAMTAAQWLDEALRERGITTAGNPQRSYLGYEPEGRLIHTYYSLPLDTLSIIANHRSQNLYAEAIARLIDPQSSPGEAVQGYWRKELGVGRESLNLVDGSGLSRGNSITPRTMTRALGYLFGGQEPHDGMLVATLPQVGKDGTVRGLMSPSELTAYLKSGTMRGVCSYAGYLYYGGEWYALTYIANGFPRAAVAREVLRAFVRAAFPVASSGETTPGEAEGAGEVSPADTALGQDEDL